MPVAPAIAPPLAATRFAVVDVETSGLRPDRHRLLQIGVVRITGDGTVLDRWDTFLRAPWRPVGGRDIHGLSRRTLRGAPRMRHVADELATLFDGSIVCAHNAEFDWLFLSRAMRRAGVAVPDALRVCTLRLSRSLDPERLRSHRLGDLCLRYDIPLIRAHDAAADAEATAMLLPRLLAETGFTERAQLEPYLEGTTTAWTGPVVPPVLSRSGPAPWPPPLPPPVGAPAVRAPLRSGRGAAAGAPAIAPTTPAAPPRGGRVRPVSRS
jgi:DNA polymerase III epsilon subunit-like protein